MNFSELEQLMSSRGVTSLADIARALNTTPQAVSNWKARNKVPYHIVGKLNDYNSYLTTAPSTSHFSINDESSINFSDLLVTMAEQLKVILLVPFIFVFLTFTYVQFIQKAEYQSWATVLLPENKSSNINGIAGLASQFGVSLPASGEVDLSSPSLFPELLKSRTFAEIILDKKFYSEKYQKKLTLLAIITHGDKKPTKNRNSLVFEALPELRKILSFSQNERSTFSTIKVTVSEPLFAKDLAEVVVSELEALNRFFKSQTLSQKTSFINERIASVLEDLEISEQRLKAFNEQNRQISSPALKLEEERLARDLEIQKGIYLTLKQQLELAKIEEVQEKTIVQVLDIPRLPLSPSNKNLIINLLLAVIGGLGIGILIGFFRSSINNADKNQRKQQRRFKNFLKKKTKDFLLDRRISGIISLLLLTGLPFYLGHQSQEPVFFGMYSNILMFVNTVYIFTLFFSIILFIYLSRKKS